MQNLLGPTHHQMDQWCLVWEFVVDAIQWAKASSKKHFVFLQPQRIRETEKCARSNKNKSMKLIVESVAGDVNECGRILISVRWIQRDLKLLLSH